MLFTRIARARDRGFSFIELLAYMAIAALLILAAIPQFDAYREQARVSNLQNDAHNAGLAAEGALIDAVSARTHGKATVRLASSVRLATATSSDQQAAITNAVGHVKTTDGNTLTTSFPDDGAFLITAANSATAFKAVYASQLSSTPGGVELKPGVNLLDGDEPVDGGDSPPPASQASFTCDTSSQMRDGFLQPDGTILGWGGGYANDTYLMKIDAPTSAECIATETRLGDGPDGYGSPSRTTWSNGGTTIMRDLDYNLLATTNNGQSWTTITKAANANNVYVSTDGDSMVYDNNGLYRATGLRSGSPSVTALAAGGTLNSVSPMAASGDLRTIVTYALDFNYTNSRTMQITRDGGQTWAPLSRQIGDAMGAAFPGMSQSSYGDARPRISPDGNVITMWFRTKANDFLLLQSTDGGLTFKKLALGDITPNANYLLDASNDGQTIALSTAGVANPVGWITADRGATWKLASTTGGTPSVTGDGKSYLFAGYQKYTYGRVK